MAKVYITPKKHEADIVGAVVDRDYQADIIVFVEDQNYRAKGDELWFMVDSRSKASSTIFWDKPYNAKLKVYFTDQKYKAKWKKSHALKGQL